MASVTFRFDAERPEAVRAANRLAADLVTNVSKETRDALRAMIVRSIQDKIPPFEIARTIRSMIGMTSRDALAAMNFREQLINRGLPPARVDARMATYVKRKIAARAKMIAQTEIMGALNKGVQQSFLDAQKDGLLPKDARREWIVTEDEILRQCPVCAPMRGQTRKLDEPFMTGTGGETQNPPAHPRCRCTTGVATD